MHYRAHLQAPRTAAALDLTGVNTVLDVGGGSGIFAMAMAKAKSGLKSTVFDLPDVVGLTGDYIEKQGMSEFVDTVPGNYNTDDLPVGFDMVLLSAIIHSNSPMENERLVQKCADSLNPGGRLAIKDFIMDDDRMHPAYGTFFALNMIVNTARGDVYTENEISSWMQKAGLENISRIDSKDASDMIVAVKPN